MARTKKPSDPTDYTQIKEFSSAQEIESGIQKLRRRVDDVQSLQRDRVAYNDQRVMSATENIRNTALEIFGPHSPEYGYVKEQWWGIFVPNISLVPDRNWQRRQEMENQQRFLQEIPQAVTLLEGMIQRLVEKRSEFVEDPAAKAKNAFEHLDLHTRIADVCSELYRDRHYRQAVLDASIALVNYVKEKSRRHDLDGAPLMSTVFSPNGPVLAFNALADQTDKDEQQGMMHLLMGAVLALRNPRAHSIFDDSPELALDAIAFLSMLAKRLDTTTRR
ncbi:MAG: TIGR02391 family protein [Candidatus Binatus sp.]|jgi:uncharacterized protein (TIGR02391 family)